MVPSWKKSGIVGIHGHFWLDFIASFVSMKKFENRHYSPFLFPLSIHTMKLRLNLSLRKALLAAMAAVATLASTVTAGVMHSDATYQTYTDFGQNCGRYVVGGKVNDLLSEIRKAENGIAITYTDGTPAFVISNEQGMINYSGTHDSGHSTVIAPTFIATVLHNGSLDGSFSERTVGQNYAINYDAIDIRGSQYFRLAPEWGNGQYDYMLQRQSKVVTDVTWNSLTSLTYEQIENLDGGYVYHSGSGTMYQWDEENEKMVGKADPYSYVIGAINNITNGQVHADGENFSIHQNPEYVLNDGASEANPLPNGIRPGDSGSPTFIYNEATGQYEYIAAQQSAGAESYGQARGNVEWTRETLKAFDVNLDMSECEDGVIHLGAVNNPGETISETVGATTYSTTLFSGNATNKAGAVIGSYIGVKSGTNTWRNYNVRMDMNNWYAAREIYWKVPGVIYEELPDLLVSDEDLFYTQNLVFTSSREKNDIILDATVDLGIGYAEFNKADNIGKAVYTIKADTAGTMFNHAGYVVNEGAEVHLRLTNPEKHMTEWRKIGAGDLYIDGTGNTNALLNVGGNGKTYLNQTGGHAAYNVLVNSGATVVIGGINQIERDLTFGAGGGTLDMNGISMDWYTTGDESREDSFTIQALTEEATIMNSSSQASNLTYRQGGNTTYKGSFSDATGKLNITYAGGGTWTLNSIHTNLSQSTFTVSNGKVVLSGVNTVHGMGSATATNTNRLMLENDWHYADANMYIEIESGAAFELGSHARLQGDVWAKSGSTFILREGVKHRYEYVEGGSQLVDTYGKLSEGSNYRYSDFYGLHADSMVLDEGASLQVEFSNGTTANTTVDASISGEGSVSVDTGLSGGTLTLAGNNSMSGTKTIVSGGLIAKSANALGDTSNNKWKIQEKGWLVSHVDDGETLLGKIDSSSEGVLALSGNTTTQLNLSGHKSLYVGAETGKTIEYGEKGTSTELVAQNGAWRLGGGGGTLNVNFVLADGVDAETGEVIKHDLIVGNEYSNGTVHLANENNSFSGIIYIKGTGNLLTYESLDALGDARVSIEYGNILALHKESDLYLINADVENGDGSLSVGAKGILATVSSFDLDISNYSIALGAVGEQTYTSKLTVDAAKGYRLGGSGSLILDTILDCSTIMQIDGQGNSGSSVTFAREHAYTGHITAGGMLEDGNQAGSIAIHAGYGNTFASVASMELQKGTTLYTDGHDRMVVQNLTAQTGARITNNGSSDSTLELHVTTGSNTTIEDGVLVDAENASLSLLKTGQGTLSMHANKEWSGGLTIREGQVNIHAGNGGVGANSNTIHIEEGGTLRVDAFQGSYTGIGNTILRQHLSGTGTIEAASGSSMLLTQQAAGFEGTVRVTNNTRLYVGAGMTYDTNSQATYNNAQAFDKATIQVTSGSQVRLTSNLLHVSETAVTSAADYIIAGDGMAGHTGTSLVQDALNTGALSIDCGATITGNVTLADNATIASWSKNVVNSKKNPNSTASAPYCWYRCNNGSSEIESKYGIKDYLGGTIRGQILGEGKTLTIAGTEGMTFTADAASTYGNLLISNANGNNTDKFALRLDGGKAVSQVSTALGTGQVDLRSNLILRLAGTGTPGQSDVVYTYDNAIMAGDNATLQSYNITNKLTGVVSMAEGADKTLNLATAEGGVLHLAGGVSGTGLLNIAAGSDVRLGGVKSTFMGDVQAAAGTKLTLDSYKALGSDSSITGIDSLTLCLGNGGGDYSLGGIRLEKSADSVATALTLRFDFTDVPDAGNTDSWSSLATSIKTDSLLVGIDLNMYNDIQKGDYVLIDDIGDMAFSLVEGSHDRLSLTNENGKLVLHVAPDGRLIWTRGDGSPQSWDAANWYSEEQDKLLTHTSGTDVLLSDRAAEGVPSDTLESIELHSDVTVGSMMVRDAAYSITGEHQLTGTELCVGSGADLKLSTARAEFVNGVQVNGAALSVEASELDADITAENFAKVSLKDSTSTGDIQATNASISLDDSSAIGEMTLSISELEMANQSSVTGNVNLSYSSASISDSVLEGNINIGKSSSLAMEKANLKGKIQLGSEGSIITASNSNTEANAWATLSGNLSDGGFCTLAVSSGSIALNGKVSLKSLSMADGESVRFYNDTNSVEKGKRIDRLELGRNGTLEVYNNAGNTCYSGSIGTLQVNEVASVKDIYNSGYLKIESLELAEGTSSGILNLVKNSGNYGASYTTIYELGSGTAAGGNFAGVVELSNTKQNNGNHSVFITLAGKDILANAAVKMNTQASGNAYLGLGIMADGVTIGGLESSLGNRALLFSGESQQNHGWNLGDKESHKLQHGDTVRTLVIDTDAGTDYVFNGRVFNNLNIVKTGEGTQAFNGISTGFDNTYNFDGAIELQEGTLIFGKDAISMLTNASSVTISGGTLDISSYDFNTSDGGLELNNFSFSENAVLALGNLNQGTTYEFFGSSGIFLSNWTDLTTDNFSINGVSLSDMGRVNLVLNMGGSFSYTIGERQNLVWNGGASGTWEKNSSAETWMGGAGSEQASFANYDSVSFNSSASLTVAERVIVQNMDVQQGAELTTEGGLTILGDLSVADGAKWTLAGSTEQSLTSAQLQNVSSMVIDADATLKVSDRQMAGYTKKNLSGTGAVELDLSDNWSNKVQLGDGFEGETYISRGWFDLSNVQVGETLRLADGVDANSASAKTTVTANLILEGETEIHANDTKSITYSGSVTGRDGTYVSNGSDTHTFDGEVNLKGFSVAHTSAKSQFNKKTTVASVNISMGAWTKFNGETSIGSATLSGSTVTFNGETSISSASIGSGTTEFNGLTRLDELKVTGGTVKVVGQTTIAGGITHSSSGDIIFYEDTAISGRVNSTAGNFRVLGGEVGLTYAGKEGNSILTLDASDGGKSKGTVRLGRDVKVSATNVYGTGGSTYVLEQGSSLTHAGKTVISNTGAGEATITSNSTDGEVYGLGNGKFELTNAHVRYVAGGNITVNNKLTNTSVESAGGGTVTVSSSGNQLAGLFATGGNLLVQGQTGVSLDTISISTNKMITASSFEISSLARFEQGATLAANLTLLNGAELDLTGEAVLNGTLTLQMGLEMGDDLLALVSGMSVGESVTLFSGVTDLTLQSTVTLYDARSLEQQTREALSYEPLQVNAADYFANLNANCGLIITYSAEQGTVSISQQSIPEPTTTALGLLALAGMAARRRRK